jgi:carboxyl-terminal processing protease
MSERTDYDAGEKNLFEKGKLAVLVDESSASASEILAGAIQDWDRGLIVGRRTFGKGLVQEQYDLGDGSALRLTIAKYYTPSGRSIQRSYAKGKDAYAEDFTKRYETGELTGSDSIMIGDTAKYYTSNKRPVYGGGGIKPDIYVPYDTLKYNSALLSIVYGEEFRNGVLNYYLKNQKTLKKYTTAGEYIKGYSVADLNNSLLTSLPENLKEGVNKLALKPGMRSFIELQMKAQLARLLFKNNGYYAVMATGDDVIRKASQALDGAGYSQLISK